MHLFRFHEIFSNFCAKIVIVKYLLFPHCELLNSWFDEFFFSVRENLSFFQITEFYSCDVFAKNSVKSSILCSKLISRNISLVQCFCHLFLVYWNQFANFLHPRKLIDTLTSLYCFLPKLISLSLAMILKTVDCIFYCETFCKKSTLFCWQPMSRFS